jgi:hypothetical protein
MSNLTILEINERMRKEEDYISVKYTYADLKTVKDSKP